MFITDAETASRELMKDRSTSDYVLNMEDTDRRLRNISPSLPLADVVRMYVESIMYTFPADLDDRLTAICTGCIELFGKTSLTDMTSLVHVCVNRDELEGGMPFTLSSMVFLPFKVTQLDDATLTRVVLHEMMHVFQRLRPDRFSGVLKQLGFENVSHSRLAKLLRARYSVRSNPDTAPCPVWMKHVSGLGNIVNLFVFNKDPTHLNDGQYVAVSAGEFAQNVLEVDALYEHPYEMIAETCARLILGMSTMGVCSEEEMTVLHGFIYT